MFNTKTVLLLMFGISLNAMANAEMDSVVVLEKKIGHTSEFNLSKKSYFQKIEKIMSSVNESVLPALETRKERGSWKLHAVLVGLGLRVEAGLGPVLNIAAKSKLQLIYTKNGLPFIP